MSNPISAGVVVCPKCGKQYPADHFKPGVRYKCPADETELSPPSSAGAVLEQQVTYSVKQQIRLGTSKSNDCATQPRTEADNQATRVLGSKTMSGKSGSDQETLTPSVFEERRSV